MSRTVKDIKRYWSKPIKIDCDTIQTAAEDIPILLAIIADANKENARLMQNNSDLMEKVVSLEMELEKMQGSKT